MEKQERRADGMPRTCGERQVAPRTAEIEMSVCRRLHRSLHRLDVSRRHFVVIEGRPSGLHSPRQHRRSAPGGARTVILSTPEAALSLRTAAHPNRREWPVMWDGVSHPSRWIPQSGNRIEPPGKCQPLLVNHRETMKAGAAVKL